MCVWGGGAPGDVQAEGAALCSLQPEMPVRGGDREGTAQRCTGLSLWEGEGQRAPPSVQAELPSRPSLVLKHCSQQCATLSGGRWLLGGGLRGAGLLVPDLHPVEAPPSLTFY